MIGNKDVFRVENYFNLFNNNKEIFFKKKFADKYFTINVFKFTKFYSKKFEAAKVTYESKRKGRELGGRGRQMSGCCHWRRRRSTQQARVDWGCCDQERERHHFKFKI